MYRFRKKGAFSTRKVAAIVAATLLVAGLALAGGWFLLTDRAKADLVQAMQRADVQIAAQDYAGAKDTLEKAIAAFPNRSDKAELTAPANKRLQEIAAKAAEQEQARAKEEEQRRRAAEQAETERRRLEKDAAELAARQKHEQDAIAAVADIKAKTAAGEYQKAIDAANDAIKKFSDTPSGKELPDLLAAATEKLKGKQDAEAAKAEAERQRQAAEAKARHDRFVKYRDEGDAAFGASPPNYEAAKIAYKKALDEENDAGVKARLDICVEKTTRQRIAVADFKVIGDVGIPQAGQAIPELLLPKFGDKYQTVERSNLEAILKEVGLTIAQIVDNPALLAGKKVQGVRYLVLGSVTKLGNISISARLVDIVRNPGDHVQKAEVSAEDARGLQNALTELVKILQMTDAEKKAYLDQAAYPQLLADARAKALAKDYDAAIALFRRALAIRSTPEVDAELQKVISDQAAWLKAQEEEKRREADFQRLFAQAKAVADGLPPDKERLSDSQKTAVQTALTAVQAALALKPTDAAALALKARLESYLGPEKELTLNLGGGVTMKLALIPAGKFTMGSPDSEKGRGSDEGPQREVTISKAFYMGVYEVTKGQFARFVADSGYRTEAEKEGKAWGWDGTKFAEMAGYSWRRAGFEQTDEHPVVNVSWNDAVAFCEWLSKKAGRKVSLPTEAQWEYAARAGTKTAYPWGDDPDDGKGWANAADQTGKKQFPNWTVFSWDDGYVFTSPVGRFKANAFGLHDMIGNVWEWCSDWHADSYANAGKTDPTGPASGSLRVLRGGAWYVDPTHCRSAYRDGNRPEHRSRTIGFRVVAVVAAGVD